MSRFPPLHRHRLLGRRDADLGPEGIVVVTMDYDVLEARYVRDYVIWLRFRDGTEGEIDLGPELYGDVFDPLRDPAAFRALRVHPEYGTLVWPNGADLAPEFLHDSVRVRA